MSDFRSSRYRCPFIHPVEGARCEKYDDDKHGDQHIVKGYWTGGDSLRWPVAAAGFSSSGPEGKQE